MVIHEVSKEAVIGTGKRIEQALVGAPKDAAIVSLLALAYMLLKGGENPAHVQEYVQLASAMAETVGERGN